MLGKIEKGEKLSEELIEILPEKESEDVREEVLEHLIARLERKDADVLMQIGDFYLSVLEEEDFENAYLWFKVASAVGIENADESAVRRLFFSPSGSRLSARGEWLLGHPEGS